MMDSVIILICHHIPARLPGSCICMDCVAIKTKHALASLFFSSSYAAFAV